LLILLRWLWDYLRAKYKDVLRLSFLALINNFIQFFNTRSICLCGFSSLLFLASMLTKQFTCYNSHKSTIERTKDEIQKDIIFYLRNEIPDLENEIEIYSKKLINIVSDLENKEEEFEYLYDENENLCLQ
jgi:hypothetical protein